MVGVVAGVGVSVGVVKISVVVSVCVEMSVVVVVMLETLRVSRVVFGDQTGNGERIFETRVAPIIVENVVGVDAIKAGFVVDVVVRNDVWSGDGIVVGVGVDIGYMAIVVGDVVDVVSDVVDVGIRIYIVV